MLPCFFPAISSVKTNLPPLEYLHLLCAVNYPQFLISAYDVYHLPAADQDVMLELLQGAKERGASLLLDCGNYERFWKRDDTWTSEYFWSVLTERVYSLAFCFDGYPSDGDPQAIVDCVEQAVLRDQSQSVEATIIPIIHASAGVLPDVAAPVVQRLQPLMIAIPERELGEGILARADCIMRVRRAMDETGATCALHLLGTGNPLSILLYSLCGADSFDGLEWCQTAVDHDTALLYHFQQREFFHTQSRFASLEKVPYTYATLGHNLVFYERWLTRIREALERGRAADLAAQYLPQHIVDFVRSKLPHIQRK